jgi:hypothetical protein
MLSTSGAPPLTENDVSPAPKVCERQAAAFVWSRFTSTKVGASPASIERLLVPSPR